MVVLTPPTCCLWLAFLPHYETQQRLGISSAIVFRRLPAILSTPGHSLSVDNGTLASSANRLCTNKWGAQPPHVSAPHQLVVGFDDITINTTPPTAVTKPEFLSRRDLSFDDDASSAQCTTRVCLGVNRSTTLPAIARHVITPSPLSAKRRASAFFAELG
jgi:hypothetical protein